MHPNEELITTFYTAFQRKDYKGMVACYHADIEFSDAVFVDLKGKRACAMWQMLAEGATDLSLVFNGVQADDQTGQAHWDATYTYSGTGRKVINRIDARFRFKDGKIIDHRDTFDLWKWASQALGPSGMLLGWTPFMQSAIRRQAAARLDSYITKKGL